MTYESKERLKKFITDYSWWGGAKTIDRNDFYVSPILSYGKLVNASQSYVADLCAFLADKEALVSSLRKELEANMISLKELFAKYLRFIDDRNMKKTINKTPSIIFITPPAAYSETSKISLP